MQVQLDGQDIDVRVLRLGPTDRLLISVPPQVSQTQKSMAAKAFALWAGVPISRVIVVPSTVTVSMVSETEQAEPGNATERSCDGANEPQA